MSRSRVTSLFENPELKPEALAARLLITPNALEGLTLKDASRVVTYMQPRVIHAGTVFIRESEAQHNDEMMLVLEGDVAVENESSGSSDAMVVGVIGPGCIIGEMGLLDGQPRSATCTAMSHTVVAVLSRAALMRLLQDNPRVAARLLLALSTRMTQRLRETSRKLRTFTQMNRALQDEIHVVMNNRTGAHRSPPT